MEKERTIQFGIRKGRVLRREQQRILLQDTWHLAILLDQFIKTVSEIASRKYLWEWERCRSGRTSPSSVEGGTYFIDTEETMGRRR